MLKKHVLTQLSPPGPSSGLHRQPGRARAVYTIIDSAMPTPSIRGNIQEISLSTAPWKPIHSFVQPRPPSGIFAQHTELGRAEFVLCLLCNKGAGAGWAGPRQTLGRDGKYLAMSESQMCVRKKHFKSVLLLELCGYCLRLSQVCDMRSANCPY